MTKVPGIQEHAEAEVEVPVMTIELASVPINVGKKPDGTVGLMVGPCVIQFVVPLSPSTAGNIGAALRAAGSGIVLPELRL